MKLIFLILLVGALSTVQSFGFSVLGVKPDLALSALIAVSFFVENIWQGFLIIALSALILKFSPGFENGIFVLSLIGCGATLVKKYHPWRYFFGNLILIVLTTSIFYLVLVPNLIFSALFFHELVFNLIAGAIIFAFLSFLWQNKIT